MTRTVILGSVLLVATVALSGCSDLSKALGLRWKSPPRLRVHRRRRYASYDPAAGLRAAPAALNASDKPLGATQTDRCLRRPCSASRASAGDARVSIPQIRRPRASRRCLQKAGAADVDPGVRARVDQEQEAGARPA